MSIHPGYAEAIFSGHKRVEFRKRRLAPDVDTVVVYATKPVGAVVGLFRLAGTDVDSPKGLWERHGHHGSIDRADYDAYYRGRDTAVGLRVAAPRRLPAPVALAAVGPASPPQSFSYLPREVLARLEPGIAAAPTRTPSATEPRSLARAAVHALAATTLTLPGLGGLSRLLRSLLEVLYQPAMPPDNPAVAARPQA